MLDKVLNTIEKHNLINAGDVIIVGISGGADSVCLLHILKGISVEYGFKLMSVHVNHGLRGEESDKDQQHVEQFCKLLKVPVFTEAVDVKKVSVRKRISLEEAAREIRYDIFSRYCCQLNANKVAVAHNKNDNSETILLNILRGTGLDGLKGIEYKRQMLIRPLLDISRLDIEKYCDISQLTYCVDSTNLQTVYTRNKVRLDLIPYINKTFGLNIVENLYRMSNLIRNDYEFIDLSAQEEYNNCIIDEKKDEISIDIGVLSTLPLGIVRRVIRKCIKGIKGNLIGIESLHIQNVVDLCSKKCTGKKICLPSDIQAIKSYNILTISKSEQKILDFAVNQTLNIPGITVVNAFGRTHRIEASLENEENNFEPYISMQGNSNIQFFDYEKVKNVRVRTRIIGDNFKPLNSNYTKRIKKYFIEIKIQREERDKILLIAMNEEVVWIIGYKISDKFKVTKETTQVLKMTYQSF